MDKKRKILYAILNWGIGHATRSLPILRELEKSNDVTVMSTGRSLELLKAELSEVDFIDYPDYSVKYTKKGGYLLFSLLFQTPKIILRLKKEHEFTEKLVLKRKFDLIISDNRYGIYSNHIPSYFITHQLRFKLPLGLGIFEYFSVFFNMRYFSKYRKIIIPDEEGEENLSGALSHNIKFINKLKLSYAGILADLSDTAEEIRSDYLIIISGPEPQRSIFEQKAVEQAGELKGKIIVVCGKTESNCIKTQDNIEIYDHAPRKMISRMIKGTKMVISRPGYSSVMEIVSQNKKALFIPTPGQTEQEYLSRYYNAKGYFHSVCQDKMDLKQNVIKAGKFECSIKLARNNIAGIINEILS